MVGAGGRSDRDVGTAALGKNQAEQPRKSLVQLSSPEPVQPTGARVVLHQHAGLPQNTEVVGASRLADGQIESAARNVTVVMSKSGHDPEPDRVAQR